MPKVIREGNDRPFFIDGNSEYVRVGDRVQIISRGYNLSPTKTINLKSNGTVKKIFRNTQTALVDVDMFKNDPRGMQDEFFTKNLTKL